MIVNGFKNLQYLKNSITLEELSELIDTEIPAIIVAAGPSLKRSIEELKRAKGRAYIFVVDRILDYILDNGIEPDFAVTIDPIKPVEYFTNRENITFPLLCGLVSNYEVLDRHKGKKIFYDSNAYFQQMYKAVKKAPPALTTGASVATAAFSSCIKLGFKKIVLVGQDLAYDGDFTHAGGIAEKMDTKVDQMVEGIDGNPVRSRYDWNEFLIWFKDVIILHPELKVIDTKDRGAKIQGTEIMPLKDVIDLYCTKGINTDQSIENKHSFDTEDLTKIKAYFEKSENDIETILKKAKEALKICNIQIREYTKRPEDTELTRKNYRKISRINDLIKKKPSYYLLDSYITSLAANDISKLYNFTDDMNNDKIETYIKSKKIYDAIIYATEFALPFIKAAAEQFNEN
jgi:hypothetical protein